MQPKRWQTEPHLFPQPSEKLSDIIDLKPALGMGQAEVSLVRDLTWEQKLALVDVFIAKSIFMKTMENLGYLVEFREGVLQEKFNILADKGYLSEKRKVITEYEPKEENAQRLGNRQLATFYFFKKYNKIYILQNEFLRSVYPQRIVLSDVKVE